MSKRNLVHNNGNMMCVVDVETTGLNPLAHDIVQVCVLPVDSDFEMMTDVRPFYGEMRAARPQNFDKKSATVSKLDFVKIQTEGIDPDRMADFFDEWFEALGLPQNKSLMPIAHNWPFDYSFMLHWLGWESMQRYFFGHYRDLMCAGLYENDKAAFNIQPYPYPKHALVYYCSQLGIQNDRAHDALHDCIATARCYKRVVQAGVYTPVAQQPKEL